MGIGMHAWITFSWEEEIRSTTMTEPHTNIHISPPIIDHKTNIRGRRRSGRRGRHDKDQSLSRTRTPHAVCYTTLGIYRRFSKAGVLLKFLREGRESQGGKKMLLKTKKPNW